MYILFLLLILGYYTVTSILGIIEINRIKEAIISENVRVKLYLKGIIEGWIPAFAVLAICLLLNINLHDIGLRKLSFGFNIWFNTTTFVVSGILLALLINQIISYIASARYREKIKAHLTKKSQDNHYGAVMNNIMVPRSKKEKHLFLYVSLTAGICEEVILRGFLYYILQMIFPNLTIIAILIISSIVFGALHSYQGINGVIKTTIIGALFGCIYLVSDSVIPGIIIHFIMDFAAAFSLSEEGEQRKS
jgi:membrane protease YdiL (CAAX protease family)